MMTIDKTIEHGRRGVCRAGKTGWLAGAVIAWVAWATAAGAVPEASAVRVTDVTASSFCLVWMRDATANPGIELYTDNAMTQRMADGIRITLMPAGSSAAAQAAFAKGIRKVRVSGLPPATTYYARAVMQDPANPDNTGYSAVQEATTASDVVLYRSVNGSDADAANDLVAFPVYVRPADTGAAPALGDLVIVEVQGAAYPVSAFVGDGAVTAEGMLDLNNLFGANGAAFAVSGGERMTIRVYRAGGLSMLTHYRRTPQVSGVVSVVGGLRGFFADINLDGKVDDQDFTEFRGHYGTGPNDPAYNPDYNFSDDFAGTVDIREFGKFSKEYGRTDVQ